MPGALYICCQCRDGPKFWDNQPQCVICNHTACSSCTYLDNTYPGDSTHMRGSTTSPQDKSSMKYRVDEDIRSRKSAQEGQFNDINPIRPGNYSTIQPTAEQRYSNQINPALIEGVSKGDVIHHSEAYKRVEKAMNFISGDPEELYTVTFHLDLSLKNFFKFEVQHSEDLESLLYLSGSGSIAFASTCREYVDRFWGHEGWQFVQRLAHANKQPGIFKYRESENVYHYVIDAWGPRMPGEGEIRMAGKARYILKFATLLTWMTSVCPQDSIHSLEPNILSYSESSVHFLGSIHISTGSDSSPIFNYSFLTKTGTKLARTGTCWFPLFPGSVVAEGFPVPERGNDMGVEIQFDVMVTLGKVSYFLEFPEGRVLKGYSTMLIPTIGSSPGTIQWHFIQANPPDQPLSPSWIPESVRQNILCLDIDDLRSYRSFVGYCSEAHVHVGTRDSGYRNVKASGAENDAPSLRFAREISPTISTSSMGIFGAAFGGKVTLTRGLYASVQKDEARLDERLLHSKKSPALLYDVEKGVGYLVPELNLVLQILHIWAANLPDEKDRDQILQKVPFIPTSAESEDYAVKVVAESKNVILREAYADEKTLFLITKLKEIFLAIEQRKDQRRLQNESTKRIPGVSGPYLRGWELIDIATCKPSPEKGTKLNVGPTDSWYKIARDNEDMIVFFSKGMADAIRPTAARVCPAWYPPPRNHYLLASVPSVKMLSEKDGGSRKSIRMTKKHFLFNAKDTDAFGVCGGNTSGACSHVHSLVSKVPNKEVVLEDRGAILLGNTTNRKVPGTNSQATVRENASKSFQLYHRLVDRTA